MQPKPVRPHKKIKLEKPGDDKGKLESSKDAYMLVYKRRDGHVSPQFPPAIVMEKVKEENRGLREELNKVGVRKEVLEDEWEHLKGAKVDVIRDLPGACFLPSLYYPLIRLWLTFFFDRQTTLFLATPSPNGSSLPPFKISTSHSTTHPSSVLIRKWIPSNLLIYVQYPR